MTTTSHLDRFAELLADAERDRTPCVALTTLHPDLTPEDAYAIQNRNIQRRMDAGARRIGRKVGLTSLAVQRQLGVDQPDFGSLLNTMLLGPGEPLALGELIQARAEAEIAFVLGADLTDGPILPMHVANATDCVLPAIEIIDSRIADWKITFADTVADNASSARFVLGDRPAFPDFEQMELAGMALWRNGSLVSSGAGAACLGHPLRAVAWLANTLLAFGEPLREGDIVLSGALGPVTPMAAGDHLEAAISGIGRLSLRIEGAP